MKEEKEGERQRQEMKYSNLKKITWQFIKNKKRSTCVQPLLISI